MTFDTVIKGGRVIDPLAGIDDLLDVGVRDGRIEAVARDLEASGARLIDAAGKCVAPGFIDTHVHIYGGIGLTDPDTVGVHQGVTAICDLGGAGTATFPDFKELVLPRVKTTVYSVVNVTAGGVGAYGFGVSDLLPTGRPDLRRFFETVDENRDVIKGVKSAVSVVLGEHFLLMAKSLAASAGLPFVLHLGEFDDWPDYCPGEYREISGRVLDLLDDGDMITHCYTPEPGRIFAEDGALLPKVRAALDRGVILDLGHSSHGFSIDVARLALAHGIAPHTLGTDLHVSSVSPVMRSLADVMSKMLALGLDLPSVVRMVTATPARFFKVADRAGSLRRGFPADVTVFEVQPGHYDWMDSHRNHFGGSQRVVPLGCLRAGVWYEARMDLVDTRENRSVAVWKAELPPATGSFSSNQRDFLAAVADVIRERETWDQLDLHCAIERQHERMGLPRRDAVYALMLAFYGKPAGQQPAWYLARASRPFVLERLLTAARTPATVA